MLNAYDLEQYARLKQAAFLVEASAERLADLITNDQPSVDQRIRGRMGDWLITLGYKLKTQPMRQSDPQITKLSC
ncbi:MAG: hypothetical protein U0401_01970 [Anaerolineae bacterium]